MPWFIPVTFADNKVRQDFFYRLNVLPTELPPLRDRIMDIPIKDADQGTISSLAAGSPGLTALSYKTAKEKILKEFNHTYIGARLSMAGGNIIRSAGMCEMDRQALQQIMKRYDIDPDKFR